MDDTTRRFQAAQAYEDEIKPARLPLSSPDRVPYPVAAKRALAAYDKVLKQ